MRQSGKIVFADGLRGIAALAVVAGHYLLVFWMPGPTIERIANVPPVPPDVMPALSRWLLDQHLYVTLGSFGVGLFFLISGFVIPLSIERLDPLAFVRARAWRLVPTYAVGFLFTVAALAIASQVYHRPFPYSLGDVMVHAIPGLRALLLTPYIDYVVWTLEIEVAFYALCVAMTPSLRRGSLLVLAAPAAALPAVLALRYDAYTVYVPSLAFMFVGVVMSFHYGRKLGTVTAAAIGATLAAASLAAAAWINGAIIVASYAAAAAVFVAAYLARARFPDLAVLRALSAISYPLYVVHGIMGYVAMRIMIDHGIAPGLAVLGAFALAFAASYALHVAVELPTQAFGKRPGWAFSRLSPRSP